MSSFSFIQKLRNKIRVDKGTKLIIEENIKITNCRIICKGNENTLIVKKGVRLRNVTIEMMGNNCCIEIGENSMIGDNCYLSAKENNIRLEIGDNCGFSRNIKVMTSDGHPIYSQDKRINPAQNIIIGNGVWIADNVTVLKGVSIGEGSVIGINSTVTKDVQASSVAVGNPAIVIKENIKWKDKF